MAIFTQKHLDLAESIQRHIRERKPGQTAMAAMAEMLCVFEVAVIGQCAMIAKERADKEKDAAIAMILKSYQEGKTEQSEAWKRVFVHRQVVSEEIANKIADLIGPATGAVKQNEAP